MHALDTMRSSLFTIMLYDIIPPTVFVLSLGGVIVILSRVIVRMQRAEVSASVQSAATTRTSHQRLFSPSRRGVQAVTSRAVLARQFVQQLGSRASHVRTSARKKVNEWRPGWEVTPAVATTAPGSVSVGSRLGALFSIVRSRAHHGVTAARSWRRERTQIDTSEVVPAVPATIMPIMSRRVTTTANDSPAATATQVVTPRASQAQTTHVGGITLKRQRQRKVVQKESAIIQARAALDHAAYDQAEDILVPYIVTHTRDTAAYMLLGEAAAGRHDWSEAMEIFEQVVNWNPRQTGVWAGLGTAAYRAGNYTRALQALQRAHESDPTNETILTDLLSIARKMDNPALQHSITEKIQALQTEQEVAA